MQGWIKVHRRLAQHLIATDPLAFALWLHLLLAANHSPCKKLINGRSITIQPGQIIASRKSLADKSGINESKVERILRMLETEQQIEQQGMSKFRLISIVNWSEYQASEQQNEQQMNNRRTAESGEIEQQLNSKRTAESHAALGAQPDHEQQLNYNRTADEQQLNTLKEVKNVKKDQELLCAVEFEAAWKLYPKREGSNPKNKAASAWNARIKEGVTAKTMIEGLARYATYCAAKELISSVFVMQAVRFFGTEKAFENEWAVQKITATKLSRHAGFDERDYSEGLFEREDGSYGI